MTKLHPWIEEFLSTPTKGFLELIDGTSSSLGILSTFESPEIISILLTGVDDIKIYDKILLKLDVEIINWFDNIVKQDIPVNDTELQNLIRKVCNVFEIISIFQRHDVIIALFHKFTIMDKFVQKLVLSTTRNAKSAYYNLLALYLPLSAAPGDSWLKFWFDICKNSDHRIPTKRQDLNNALMALLRYNTPEYSQGKAYIIGLIYWAFNNKPDDNEFWSEWFKRKLLINITLFEWRKIIKETMSDASIVSLGISFPAWWKVDPEICNE